MNENYMDEIIKRELIKETIEVPEEIKSKINDTLENLNIKKGKKTKFKIATAAAIILAVFLTVGITMPAYAQNIPIIGSIFKFLDNGFYTDYDKYASDINVSKESNGVKVTITSIVYDGIVLNVAYKVEGDEPMKTAPHILDKDFRINGKLTTFSSGGSGEFLDDNKIYVGVEEFDVSKDEIPKEVQEKTLLGGYVEIPDEFTLTLNIKELLGGIVGKWNFNIPVTSEKVNGLVQERDVGKDLDEIATNMKINKVITTPINTVVYARADAEYDPGKINFIVIDDKGRMLQMKSASGSGDNEAVYLSYIFKEKYEDTKSLTFIPYEDTHKTEVVITDFNIKGETRFNIQNYDNLIINRVEETEDGTKIYYKTKYGFLIYPCTIIDKETGKEYLSSMPKFEEDSGEYSVIFKKLDEQKSYRIECEDISKTTKIYDDLKFIVNLD